MGRNIHTPPVWWLIWAGLIIGLVVVAFGSAILKGIKTRRQNSQSPLLERPATVSGRRQEVWGERTRTDYYVAFEFADGFREEFEVKGEEYETLAEGDVGVLTSQGTWFKGFRRNRG